MGLRKWLMKQHWRIVQVRGIWNLFYGILLLAIAYFAYIPYFADMGAMGPFAFAGMMFFVFLILGYIYDRVLVMWSPQQEIVRERDPYQYVPQPRDHIFWFPIFSGLLEATEGLAKQFDIDTTTIDETREYYAALEQLKPERITDIDVALELRKDFLEKHRFKDIIKEDV